MNNTIYGSLLLIDSSLRLNFAEHVEEVMELGLFKCRLYDSDREYPVIFSIGGL